MIFEALCAYAVYKGAKKVSAWNKEVVGNKEVIKVKKARTNKLQQARQARNKQAAAEIMTGVALLPLLPLLLLLGQPNNRKPRKRVAYEDMEFKGGSRFHL